MMNQQNSPPPFWRRSPPLPGGQSHGGQRGGLRRRGARGHPAGAWERLDTLRQPQYFRTWLTRILINECKGILRQRGRQAPYDQAAAEAIPPRRRRITATSTQALGALEEKYRLPVVMYYWEGFKTRRSPPSACRRGP